MQNVSSDAHQSHNVLIPHSSMLNNNMQARHANLERTVEESTSLIDNNISNIMNSEMPFANLLRTQVNSTASVNNNVNSVSGDSYVINFDDGSLNTHSMGSGSTQLQPLSLVNTASTQATNNNDEPSPETLQQMVQAQHYMRVLQRYVPLLLILISKALYDHREGILNFIILLVTFAHANSVVKNEATKHGRRSFSKLLMALMYIIICLGFINFIFNDEKLYLHLVFIPTYRQSLHVFDLLWIIGITDFILKLITVAFKILLSLLPAKVIQFQRRGKIYLFMEATSQLYRSMATIQPWLYYLLESYQGTEKVVGVFLSAAYMISKGADLMVRVKLFKSSTFRLLQNVTLGSSPSKDQILMAGNHCPICHDEYDAPVLLECRHIFCETCVSTWFDREQTCPLCRAKIADDPSWRDGSTTFFIQLY